MIRFLSVCLLTAFVVACGTNADVDTNTNTDQASLFKTEIGNDEIAPVIDMQPKTELISDMDRMLDPSDAPLPELDADPEINVFNRCFTCNGRYPYEYCQNVSRGTFYCYTMPHPPYGIECVAWGWGCDAYTWPPA